MSEIATSEAIKSVYFDATTTQDLTINSLYKFPKGKKIFIKKILTKI